MADCEQCAALRAEVEQNKIDLEEYRRDVEKLRAALRDCADTAVAHHAENVSRVECSGSDTALRKARAIVARSGVLMCAINDIASDALDGQPAPAPVRTDSRFNNAERIFGDD